MLGQFNRLLLSFDLLEGPWDDALLWTQLPAATRRQILDEYHAAGIALMVSAFGATDVPTTVGADPVGVANSIATFVKQYEFDGVDIDYEDFGAFALGTGAQWLITFQTQLRSQLGSGYLISHAPVAPWFDRAAYKDGAYAAVYSAVGNTIDFFNLQYYNQYSAFTDCTSLITDSGSTQWPGVAIQQLHEQQGIPYDKLVLGKPISTAAQNNGGYMDPSALAQCVAQGKALGWPGSVMFWQWSASINAAQVIQEVIGN
ncbi:Endochitinase 4 [Vanrija pseudolonga]|uniref:Endochitinase 4 n=1 Tax=Vanrija pseudolonga TaxID=143232 RepID=A0AAF0Y912_9TREE|nr:Endochitinase 4 [Vanrija pseudolonga]